MAINWDKLSKSQRDYPKPKFALPYIDKLLKKNPGNPYLTAWRADVSLQLQSEPGAVLKSLRDVCQHKTTLQDDLLLELDHVNSVGLEGVKAWQSAASLKTTKKSRKDLWDALFTTAMRQGCWDDVRTAIVKYRAEAASSDKLTYYTQIFAQQMSAEQKIEASSATGVADRMAEIQLGVALRQMKDAYERPENDPISVKDICDLRFMAKIYARQGKCAELLELWKAPPAHLQPIMEKHSLDISLLTVDVLATAKQYEPLEKHVLGLIENATTALNEGNPEPLRQLCSARANIWTYLVDAYRELYSLEEAKAKISTIKNEVFDSDALKLDRPLRLVRLLLRAFLGESLLQDCKDFWKNFSRMPSCFTDLRRAVEKLNDEERTDFLAYIEEDMVATKSATDGSESKLDDWTRAEICVLKFIYLIRVSLATSQVSTETLEALVERAAKISQTLPKDPDPIMLIAYCLTYMQHQGTASDDNSAQSSRLLLQATMLVRAAVDRDTEKENRPLALLATRLHLDMGLGRVAFQLWRHVKVKEMLVDTLSPYLLSRIAITHPFDVKHHQGFSADKELKHVVDTIDRMRRVQEGLIFRDVKRFHWDSAFDLISMNDKLKASLTRHTAVLERRRIARLKGEPAGDLPDVNYSSTQTVSDNVDRTVFPTYGHSSLDQPYPFLTPSAIPSLDYTTTFSHAHESTSKVLYRDGLPINWDPIHPSQHTSETGPERLATERFWHPISTILHAAHHPATRADASLFTALTTNLAQLRKEQEALASTIPTNTTSLPLIASPLLLTALTTLEALRALPRLATEIRERVLAPKTPHPLKSSVPKDWAKNIDADAKAAFDAVQKVANTYMRALQARGAAAFKKMVREGATGGALSGLLSEDDVAFYSQEYVDAGVEAWKGVLSVEMK